MNFPLAVRENRFFAPLFVFILGIGGSFLLLALLCFGLGLLLLFRSEDHDHAPSFHPRRLVHFRDIFEAFHQPLEEFGPAFLVRNLTPTEHNGGLHLVTILEKLDGVPGLEIEIVNISIRMKPELLQERDMLMSFLNLVLFCQLVLELPEIDDLDDGGVRIGDDLDEIGIPLSCEPHRGTRCHHTELTSMLVNDAHLRHADLFIDAGAFFLAN